MGSLKYRRFALFGAALLCLAAGACHDGAKPPVSPSMGMAGTPGDLDVGAPAIRFSVKPEPLLGLTASDGTGLRLTGMSAQAVVDGSVAFTELHLTFDNPESRTLEGRFRIALPTGAALQRFAMKIGSNWQESEVVELTAAREAYEDALHRRQDPALLENAAGNEFTARVFPIPANARKELVVSYVQELHQQAYVLPLKGLPEVGRLDAQVTVVGAAKQVPRMTISDDKPSADFVVDLATVVTDKSTAIRSGELVVARVKPQAESKPDPLSAAIVLVDTSASRALGFEEEMRTVSLVVSRAAAAHGQITVATFDQTVTPVYDGDAAKFAEADLSKVRTHGALGASNLQAALDWARENAKKSAKKRIVLVTDGVATAGATDAKSLTATVSSLRASGIERIDAVATGGIRDDAGLLKLVRNLLPRDGVVVAATEAPNVIAKRLDEATRSGVPVSIEGATWAWPTKLDGVQAGDEISIYAEVPAGQPVKVALDGKPAAIVESRATARPLVERVVAQAQVASLLERELLTQQDLKKEITALAVRHRVLTPYTAMLVLETEQDYARFRIDRRAPAEILAIDDGKIVRVTRAGAGRATNAPIEINDQAIARAEGTKAADTKATAQKQPRVAATASASPPKPSSPPADRFAEERKPKPTKDSSGSPPGNPAGGLAGPSQPQPSSAAPSGASAGIGNGRGGTGGGGSVAPRAAARPRAVASDPAVAAAPPPPPAATHAAPARIVAAEAPMAKAPAKKRDSAGSGGSSDDTRAREALSRAQTEATLDGDFAVAPQNEPPPPPPPPPPSPRRERTRVAQERPNTAGDEDVDRVPAYTGRFKEVMDQLSVKDTKNAFNAASAWRSEDPGDVMALIALGETSEAIGAPRLAARAYGSIVDLFPNRADLRRFAGERLERLTNNADAAALAIDTFEKARKDRPDHPASHRLLAMAYLRGNQPQKAFDVLVAAVQQHYPEGRFRGVDRILREDLGLAAAAWIRQDPKNEDDIRRQLSAAGGVVEDGPSLRFVLVWETDANDVDFHIYDGEGNHAFYGHKSLATGGDLYADVTTGYGPECFTVRGPREERIGPYKLQAHYYSRGPMGYGMGKLQVIEHDGKGNFTFDDRPFVVMNDHAFVDLGTAK